MKKLRAYKSTSVNWAKSQAQIGKLLDNVGIKDVRFTFMSSQDSVICEFNYPQEIDGKVANIGVRMVIKIPKMKNDEQAKNVVHRALYHTLKAKFVSMEFGIEEFLQVFMAHLVVFDKKGNSSTMYQLVAPQYYKGLAKGEQGDIKMLPDHSKEPR